MGIKLLHDGSDNTSKAPTENQVHTVEFQSYIIQIYDVVSAGRHEAKGK
jgi:hypothetical protein